MAYVVLKLRVGGWALRHDRYESGKRLQRRIPKHEYLRIGFDPDMTEAQARERAKQLSATESLANYENRRSRIEERLKHDKLRQSALLPLELEFQPLLTSKRELEQWKTARKAVLAVPVQLEHWESAAQNFYQYFIKNKLSADWSWRVLRLVNKYGKFVATIQHRAFMPIPMPRGLVRQQLTDSAAHSKSLPLRPEELESAKELLSVENYNWLYVSVWLGLRPEEIDHPQAFETHQGYRCIKVYQSKLVRLPKDERFKIIPCLVPEQAKAFTIMESRAVKRPLVKTLRKHIKPGLGVYGGRHGFVRLMKSLGRNLEEISAWMGHVDINRTRKDYEERNQLIIKP